MPSKPITQGQAATFCLLALFGLGLCQAHAAGRFPHAQAKVFPGSEWARWPTPGAAGWSVAKLKTARKYTTTTETAAVLIVQGGKVVDEWG